MRAFFTLFLAASVYCQNTRINFGSSSKSTSADPEDKVNQRLGLLGPQLGLSPTGSSSSQSGALTQGQSPTGRVPSGGEFTNNYNQCCCVHLSKQCGDPEGRDLEEDLVGLGLIDPRLKPQAQGLSTRIVNRPPINTNSQQNSCPSGQKACCYDSSVDHALFGRSCVSPSQAQNLERVNYRCTENNPPFVNGKQCGTRNFNRPVSGLQHGESSPGEFPWTCLILNQNNDFIGSCAIIPDPNNRDGTNKVVTAAHKLKNVQKNELLKVRVGEYDASGFNAPETVNHDEYTVKRFLKHPQFNSGRLSNDIAILYTIENINLNNPNANAACLPSCRDQFSHTFQNGTGLRCWVAGWGKNEVDGSFQFIQHKVDLPLVENNECNNKLKNALDRQSQGSGRRFKLSTSEICAGGQVGKDACTGDGGSPLVCQAESGRWTVVGLVTWGVGCASDVPGVYARMSHFVNWINQN